MIARLRGKVIDKELQTVLLDLHGIGFELSVPLSTSEALTVGEEATLLTHLYVREDALQLFGFLTEAEKELFLHLTSVSGVGPRVALNLLSARGVEELREAIVSGDLGALTSISGVGRKTAERIIVELREKLGAPVAASGPPVGLRGVAEEAVLALVSLGFARREAEQAVLRVLKDANGRELGLDEMVREALKVL